MLRTKGEADDVSMNTAEYLSIIENIKREIRAAQYRAAVHANIDMLLLYHDIGCVINEHLLRSIQIGNLCRRCLHKFRGLIILQFWKKSKTHNSVYGILKNG